MCMLNTLSEKTIHTLKKEFPIRVGKRIQQLRKEKSISQSKLAELTNKDRQYIYKIEKGKVTPNIVTLKILVTAFSFLHYSLFQDILKRRLVLVHLFLFECWYLA